MPAEPFETPRPTDVGKITGHSCRGSSKCRTSIKSVGLQPKVEAENVHVCLMLRGDVAAVSL